MAQNYHMLVFGKNGQVAQALQRKTSPAIEITAIGRPLGDITDPDRIAVALDAHKPDIVVNAAAYTAVDAAEENAQAAFALNANACAELAKLTAERKTPLIHISTDYVYSGNKPGAYVETDETGPLGVYGQSKLEGEFAIREANPSHVILRTAWVYSPFGKNFLKTMLHLAKDRDEVSVVSDQIGNPTSAHEIASAILVISRKILDGSGFDAFGTYHFAGSEAVSWADFAREIFRQSALLGGPSAKVKDIPASDFPTPAKRPFNSRLDCEKLETEFGFERSALSSLIADVVRQLRETDK